MRILFIFAVTVMLAGCTSAPKNIQELERQNFKQSFSVSQSYQHTYRNIKNGFLKCTGLESSWLKPFAVETDIYTDIEEGHITVNLIKSIGQPEPFTYIRIKKTADNNSLVDIYYRWKDSIKKEEQSYQRWANGDLTCD